MAFTISAQVEEALQEQWSSSLDGDYTIDNDEVQRARTGPMDHHPLPVPDVPRLALHAQHEHVPTTNKSPPLIAWGAQQHQEHQQAG